MLTDFKAYTILSTYGIILVLHSIMIAFLQNNYSQAKTHRIIAPQATKAKKAQYVKLIRMILESAQVSSIHTSRGSVGLVHYQQCRLERAVVQ